jgi:hypothetical protein
MFACLSLQTRLVTSRAVSGFLRWFPYWYSPEGGVIALATWWRGDSVPELSLLPGFRVEGSRDAHLIADITRLAPDEVDQRLHTGHQPYLAFVEQAPVGYGWMWYSFSGSRVSLIACSRSWSR